MPSRPIWSSAIFLLLLISSTPNCRAAFVISAPTNIQVVSGGIGSFDVTIADTDPTGSKPRLAAGFQLELRVLPSSGITFLGASTETAMPYLFAGNSANEFFGIPFASPGSTPTDLMLSDTVSQFNTFTTISPGSAFGLARIFFQAANDAPLGSSSLQIIPFSLTSSPDGTLISDQAGGVLSTAIFDGQVSVVVPEPASFFLSLSGLAMFMLRSRLSRKIS